MSEKEMARTLRDHVVMMSKKGYTSPLDQNFVENISTFYTFFDQWQREVLSEGYVGDSSPLFKDRAVTCADGCAHCCNHWVEDVYSFEIALLVTVLGKSLAPSHLAGIAQQCQADEDVLMDIVEESGSEDEIELLTLFFQRGRPCPFLLEDNSCGVYEYRPLTCRSFFSRQKAEFCTPAHSYDSESATFITEPPHPVEDLLDAIDAQFSAGDGPTGLRSQIWRALESAEVERE